MIPSRWFTRLSAIVALAWIGAVGYRCFALWPHFPLDMSANDAATAAAFDQAVTAHLLYFAVIAFGPPLAALLLALARRRVLHKS